MQKIFVSALLFIFFTTNIFAQKKINIAVMDLTGEGISPSDTRIITSRLRTDLFNTKKFTVVERERMKDILDEQGFQLSGCTSNECAVEAGRLLGVKQIVSGVIGKLGSLFTITIRLIDIETGKIVETATEDCKCDIEEVLLTSVKNVAEKLAGERNRDTNTSLNKRNNKSNNYEIINKEIRYAESLFKRHKLNKAKEILSKYLYSEYPSIQEEANAYYILWGFSKDEKEDFEKFKSYFPNSDYIPIIAKRFSKIKSNFNLGIPPMIFINGGTFMMGDIFNEGKDAEKPVHSVKLNDYYISKYEITVSQYSHYCKKVGIPLPDYNSASDAEKPVINIRFNEAQNYVDWLSSETGDIYAIPSEAQWEYAARNMGKKERFAGTSSYTKIGLYAWYTKNSNSSLHPVGQKKPNSIGLYDMNGNALEWCSDYLDDYPNKPQVNPIGPMNGTYHVVRGGSYKSDINDIRNTSRPSIIKVSWSPQKLYSSKYRSKQLGFRIVKLVK